MILVCFMIGDVIFGYLSKVVVDVLVFKNEIILIFESDRENYV